MSFALTTEQVRNHEKTVTRRLGWKNAKRGDVVQPVEKCQGLKKGEKVTKIGGPIRFTNVTRELLGLIDDADVAREGFPGKDAQWFVDMFTRHNRCQGSDYITRIEFEYVEPA